MNLVSFQKNLRVLCFLREEKDRHTSLLYDAVNDQDHTP